MSSHRIHLKGPWDFAWLTGPFEPAMGIERSGTVTMPREWRTIFGANSGSAQFQRKFHAPTNLEAHERVILVLTEVRGPGSVSLNQHPVGEFQGTGVGVEFEVTTFLKTFNQLVVTMEYDATVEPVVPGGLYGAVALDIRSVEVKKL